MHKEAEQLGRDFGLQCTTVTVALRRKKPKVQFNESTKWVPKFKNFIIIIVKRNYIVRFLYFRNCKLQVIDNQFESIEADN